MPIHHVLVIDDEPNLRRVLAVGLRHAGFSVETADGAGEALAAIRNRRPDAIILDINLPHRDGFELLGDIRRLSDAPVIMLTARADLDDKLDALGAGADDYVTKPFAMAELCARIEAHLRRRPQPDEALVFGDVVLELGSRRASRGGRDLELSGREFDLLAVLLREQGRVFRKSQLLDRVWGVSAEVGTETVDRFVSLLRQKLEAGGEPRLVQTVRGVGYAMRQGGDDD